MKRKFMIAIAMCAMMAAASVSTTAFAATTNIGSTGSDSTDISVGADTVQGKVTTYSGEITADATEACQVYATQGSTFSVSIPKVIILDGTAGAANDATYKVTAKGNIAGNEVITIAPEASFLMTQTGKADLTTTVDQTVQKFVAQTTDPAAEDTKNGVNPTTALETTGTVTAAGMEAGSYAGTFDFTISLNEA